MSAPSQPGQNEMAYAVHTTTCTYLLDEHGVCRWIVSPQGIVPRHVQQCIGAQFVASLDLSVEGGLVGQLKPGGHALFVGHNGENMLLLRTAPIQRVDDRRDPSINAEPAPAAAVAEQTTGTQYGRRPAAGLPRAAGPSFGVVKNLGDEQTITFSITDIALLGQYQAQLSQSERGTAPFPVVEEPTDKFSR